MVLKYVRRCLHCLKKILATRVCACFNCFRWYGWGSNWCIDVSTLFHNETEVFSNVYKSCPACKFGPTFKGGFFPSVDMYNWKFLGDLQWAVRPVQFWPSKCIQGLFCPDCYCSISGIVFPVAVFFCKVILTKKHKTGVLLPGSKRKKTGV